MPGVLQSNFIRNMDPATINGIGQMVGIDEIVIRPKKNLDL